MQGFSTVLCHDFRSAQEILAEGLNQIDLCLFDLSLPDGSGYELCSLVKQRSDIPVIFLTAIDDEVNVVMGLDIEQMITLPNPFALS